MIGIINNYSMNVHISFILGNIHDTQKSKIIEKRETNTLLYKNNSNKYLQQDRILEQKHAKMWIKEQYI